MEANWGQISLVETDCEGSRPRTNSEWNRCGATVGKCCSVTYWLYSERCNRRALGVMSGAKAAVTDDTLILAIFQHVRFCLLPINMFSCSSIEPKKSTYEKLQMGVGARDLLARKRFHTQWLFFFFFRVKWRERESEWRFFFFRNGRRRGGRG